MSISLRKRLSAVVFLGAAVCLGITPASAQTKAGLEPELVIVSTGGAFEQALKEHFYEPFTKATGVKVRPVSASNSDQWAKARAMARANATEWDIVSTNPDDLIAQRDLLQQIDCKALKNLDAAVEGACEPYGLLRTIGGGVIAANTKALPGGKAPRTWAEF